ncbi:hypothetical protein [Olleya sp. HaHaR_3_96]|uniref:hypothetical protein n=1 Tax=Olleya sp. HaHaR_3_96 TaxID=2745560 RepID=UPI001C4F2A00|nr:hypothetical protein [Olleya sp. HaHaR_3_96]QXP60860.1 hypothetical protein H0I26_04270 [Olleya sp. HaHaR_3_96]
MELNLAYYRRKDWKKFLKMIDDKDAMHDSWNDWHKSFLKTKHGLISKGFIVNDFIVDLDKLKIYCSNRNLKIDGKARSQFVTNIK